MSRFPRFAAIAVLGAALFCCAQTIAAPVQTARLEIARVFNPQSESLFGALLAPPRDLSMLSIALFNVAQPSDIAVREVAAFLPAAPRNDVSKAVNVAGIEPMRTFTAPPAAAYAVPAPHPAAISASSDPAKIVAPRPSVTKPLVAEVPPVARFGTYQPYTPSIQGMTANVAIPVRVGGVHFSGLVGGSEMQTSHTDMFRAVQLCGTTDEASACPYLHESTAQTVVAGTNFNVHTWDRDVNVQLSGTVSRLSNGDAGVFPYVPLDPDESFDLSRSNATAPGNTMLYYPGVTALVKHGVDARLAVPINQRLSVGLQYDTLHYQGDYGTALAEGLTQGLDARKDTYLGNVTYQLPNTNSAITLSTRLYRYQDGFSQNFNLTQMRTDLNFTVKF